MLINIIMIKKLVISKTIKYSRKLIVTTEIRVVLVVMIINNGNNESKNNNK